MKRKKTFKVVVAAQKNLKKLTQNKILYVKFDKFQPIKLNKKTPEQAKLTLTKFYVAKP